MTETLEKWRRYVVASEGSFKYDQYLNSQMSTKQCCGNLESYTSCFSFLSMSWEIRYPYNNKQMTFRPQNIHRKVNATYNADHSSLPLQFQAALWKDGKAVYFLFFVHTYNVWYLNCVIWKRKLTAHIIKCEQTKPGSAKQQWASVTSLVSH